MDMTLTGREGHPGHEKYGLLRLCYFASNSYGGAKDGCTGLMSIWHVV